MRPRDANSRTVRYLLEDNMGLTDCWILTDGLEVTLKEQKPGEAPTQGITLPRATFNKLIDWYMRPQKPHP